MSRIHGYPKVWAVGSDRIPHLFKGTVEVTEKIDGSQFGFGITAEGTVVMRSKGKELFFEDHAKMFTKAVDFVDGQQDKLRSLTPDGGLFFYGEFLGSASHNILKYGRTPVNGIIVFGVMEGESWVSSHDKLVEWADKFDLEAVPLMHRGEVASLSELHELLKRDSVLGEETVEGVVVKNYVEVCVLGSMVWPSFGKFIRESFKERHANEWGPKFSGRDKLAEFIDSFRTDARWQKAVQHLMERGELENEPRDIGKLLKELQRDLFEEEKGNIEKKLFGLFKDQIARKARAGFPEWYKERLAARAFSETT